MGGCFSKNRYLEGDGKGSSNRPGRRRRGNTGVVSYQHYKHPVYYHPRPTTQQRHAHQVTVKSTQPGTILGKPYENIRAHYTLGRELGRGQYGVIYFCTENSTRRNYACKSILKRKLVNRKDTEDIKREIQMMQHLSGQPNIVEFKGAYEDHYAVHLVMELCAGGELFDRIIARGYYSEKDAADIIRQIVNVVYICHFMGVMHRDLKPENFLLTSKDEHTMIKATDFGLSVFIEQGKVYRDIVGSAYYVAPEVLRRSYGKEADVWSAGVILYILLSGVPPFWDETEKGIFHAILQGEIDFHSDPWPSISNSAKDLVRKMLTQDAKSRITSAEVLDADFAGYQVDRKSTSGMAHFLGSSLISWGTKKQNSVALSTAEAEYVAAAACCSQLLWIRQHLEDFGIHIKAIPLMCDNTSAVSMGKNPVHHKRTKHIDVRHHFLRDHVEKGNIVLTYCPTEEQIADIFTKALSKDQFERNRLKLGMLISK